MLTKDDLKNIPMLTDLTGKLLEAGLDYEVTLKGSEVTVELSHTMTGDIVGVATANSLESALGTILVRCAQSKGSL